MFKDSLSKLYGLKWSLSFSTTRGPNHARSKWHADLVGNLEPELQAIGLRLDLRRRVTWFIKIWTLPNARPERLHSFVIFKKASMTRRPPEEQRTRGGGEAIDENAILLAWME